MIPPGTVYGPFTVVKFAENRTVNGRLYLVRCKCGAEYQKDPVALGCAKKWDQNGCKQCFVNPNTGPKPSPAITKRNKAIIAACRKGATIRDVAVAHGVSPGTVSTALWKAGYRAVTYYEKVETAAPAVPAGPTKKGKA